MIKLDILEGNIIIDDGELKLKEFVDIKNIKNKTLGTQILIYIFLNNSISDDNPIRDLKLDLKSTEAKKLAFGNPNYKLEKELGKTLYKMLQEAESKFKANFISDSDKDIMSIDRKMDELNSVLESIVPKINRNTSDKTGHVSYSSNIDLVNSTLRDIVNIIQSKASLGSNKNNFGNDLRASLDLILE